MFLARTHGKGRPVNKKLTATLGCAAAATLALAGCSNSDDQANAYAKKVCDQVRPQQQTIEKATGDIAAVSDANASPAQVEKTDSAAFQQISNAYKTLSAAVQKAGASPVDNGAKLQQNAVKQLNGISVGYANLAKSVKELNTSDQAKFADGLKNVSGQLSVLSKSSGDALTKLQAGDIGKAMAKQPGCQKASASANPA
jgi:hypothetical protein